MERERVFGWADLTEYRTWGTRLASYFGHCGGARTASLWRPGGRRHPFVGFDPLRELADRHREVIGPPPRTRHNGWS